MVWTSDEISIEMMDAGHPAVLVLITTPVSKIELLASLAWQGRTLVLGNAHIDGLSPGALGRAGLNAIARKLLEVSDAEALFVEGFSRATGAVPGHKPKPFRFPR